MGFVYNLERHPNFSILEEGVGGDQHTIECRLGEIEGENQNVLMSISLMSVTDFVRDIRFGFRLQDQNHQWKVSAMDYALTSKSIYTKKEDRNLIIDFIGDAVVCISRFVDVRTLTMSTFYQGLPDKALTKYAKIEAKLVAQGWTTRDSYRDEKGYDRWLFVRT